jgi:hypothetical protein
MSQRNSQDRTNWLATHNPLRMLRILGVRSRRAGAGVVGRDVCTVQAGRRDREGGSS